MGQLRISEVEGGVVFGVKVVAASSRTCLAGVFGGMLKVKVAAPPEKGKANLCLIEFLAKKLGVKKKDVSIAAGKTNPVKRLQVLGIAGQVVADRLCLDS